MARADIPVDPLNPGQVFACLGLMEVAEALLGDAEGGFDWVDGQTRFHLSAAGEASPVEAVLRFLAEAEVLAVAPAGWIIPKKKPKASVSSDRASVFVDSEDEPEDKIIEGDLIRSGHQFPSRKPDLNSLPIRFVLQGMSLDVGHWADGSGRDTFKLYSGNRSALGIMRSMLGSTEMLGANQKHKTISFRRLWWSDRQALTADPFNVTGPMGGSFNFDPRGAWTAMDAGFSIDQQKYAVNASPLVEVAAAIALENARPEVLNRDISYGIWRGMMPLALARMLLFAPGDQHHQAADVRCFTFALAVSGKNKVITLAKEIMP